MKETNAFEHHFEKEVKEIDHHIHELNRQKQEIEKKIREQYHEQEVWEEKINQEFHVYMKDFMKDIYRVKKAKYWGVDENVRLVLMHDTHEMRVSITITKEKGVFSNFHVLFTVCLNPEENTKSVPYVALKEKLKDFLRTELEKNPETRLIALTSENWATVQVRMVNLI